MKNIKKLHNSKRKFVFPLSKKNIFFVILGIVVIFMTISLFGKTSLLAVDNIQIDINNASCITHNQVEKDSNLKGKKILFIDEKPIVLQLKNKYPCVADIKLKKKFPKSIRLTLEGRIPIAKVGIYRPSNSLSLDTLEASPSSEAALLNWYFPEISLNQFLLSDVTGFLFSREDKADLPVVFLPETSIKIGQQLNSEQFWQISTVFNKISVMEFPVLSDKELKQINIGSESARLIVNRNLSEGWVMKAKVDQDALLVEQPQRIVFSLNNNILRQLASLQLILQKAKIEGKAMELIDLRFENPVVKYYHGKR